MNTSACVNTGSGLKVLQLTCSAGLDDRTVVALISLILLSSYRARLSTDQLMCDVERVLSRCSGAAGHAHIVDLLRADDVSEWFCAAVTRGSQDGRCVVMLRQICYIINKTEFFLA